MYKKVCTRCTRNSYSSSELDEWICPSCGKDLTDDSFYWPNTFRDINDKVFPVKRKLDAYRGSSNKYN